MLKGDIGAKRTWFYENGAFVAAALAAVLWHAVLSTNVGDDMVYFKTLLDGNSSLGEILAHRYETWSSRMVIEAVLIPLVHCPLLWKILDIVIFTSLPVLLGGLLGVTGCGRWFVTGLVLLYPFADLASAGWIATTTNYLWPLWGVLVIGMVLKQLRCGRKVPVWEATAALLACAYAGSQEQAAVLLLLLLGMEVLHYISEKRMKQPLLYALCGIDIISLVYILSCPGNAIRSAQEMAGRMPEFADFTFAEKLYMGLANVERIFIAELDPVYCVVAAVLVLLVYRKTGDYRKTLLAGIPALLLFGQAVVRVSHPSLKKVFVRPEQTTHWDWHALVTYMPLVFLVLSVFGILYALWQLADGAWKHYLWTAFLLAGGFATGVVMGFSPTIYASADRPYLYLYFVLIYVCADAVWNLGGMKAVWKTGSADAAQSGSGAHSKGKMPVPEKLMFTVLGLLVLANILDVTRMCWLLGRLL